jgi:hypothetical protein
MQNLRYGWAFFRLAWKVGGKERRLLNPSLVIVLTGLLWTLICLVPVGFILYLGEGSYLGLILMGFLLIFLVAGLLTIGHIFSIATASLYYAFNHPDSSLPSAWKILGRTWLDVLALSAASSGIGLIRMLSRRQPVKSNQAGPTNHTAPTIQAAPIDQAALEISEVKNPAAQADTLALFRPPVPDEVPPAGSETPALVSEPSPASPLSLAPEGEPVGMPAPDPLLPSNETAPAPPSPKPSFAWSEATYLIIPILAVEGLPLRECIQRADQMVIQKLVRIDPALINVRGVCRWLGALLALIGLGAGVLVGMIVSGTDGGSALLDALGTGAGGLIASLFGMAGIAAGYFATTLYHTNLYEWACAVENIQLPASEIPPVPALLAAVLGVSIE